MSKYSEVSNSEINKRVAQLTGVHSDEEGPCWFDYAHMDSDGEPERHSFDPCNNPSDTWPIIIKNEISLLFNETQVGKYTAAGGESDGFKHQFEVTDDNPLRAAMIVYLMMQEQKA
jgi:hypothetical protein